MRQQQQPGIATFSGKNGSSIPKLPLDPEDERRPVSTLRLEDFDFDQVRVAANALRFLKFHRATIRNVEISKCYGRIEQILSALPMVDGIERLSLSLGGDQFDSPLDGVFLAVGNVLCLNERLTHLQISCGTGAISESAARGLEEGLGQSASLLSLSLRGVRFDGVSAVQALSRGLTKCRHLEEVALRRLQNQSGRLLNDRTFSKILVAICDKNLKHLDISENACEDLSWGALSLLQSSQGNTLLSLDISHQTFDRDVAKFSGLAGFLSGSRSLRHLDSSFNKVNEFGLCRILRLLTLSSGDLRTLNLRGNRLDDDAISTFIAMLPHVQSNRHICLDLRQNPITESGAKDILTAIKSHSQLETCRLDASLSLSRVVQFEADRNWVKNVGQLAVNHLWPVLLGQRLKGRMHPGADSSQWASTLFALLRERRLIPGDGN